MATQRQGNDRPPTPRAAQSAADEVRALELRRAGANFDQIAQQLGMASRSGAWKVVSRAIQRRPAQAVEELRTVEGDRLDRMQLVVWPLALAGDLKAMAMLLQIIRARMDLYGLKMPVKVEVDATVTERSSVDVELDKMVGELERRAQDQQ